MKPLQPTLSCPRCSLILRSRPEKCRRCGQSMVYTFGEAPAPPPVEVMVEVERVVEREVERIVEVERVVYRDCPKTLPELLAVVEPLPKLTDARSAFLKEALRRTGDHVLGAAAVVGIGKTSAYRWMRSEV